MTTREISQSERSVGIDREGYTRNHLGAGAVTVTVTVIALQRRTINYFLRRALKLCLSSKRESWQHF